MWKLTAVSQSAWAMAIMWRKPMTGSPGPRKPNQGRLSHVRILQIRADSRCHEWGHGRVIPGAHRSEGARRFCRRQPDSLISKWMRILGWNWFADGGMKELHQKTPALTLHLPRCQHVFMWLGSSTPACWLSLNLACSRSRCSVQLRFSTSECTSKCCCSHVPFQLV